MRSKKCLQSVPEIQLNRSTNTYIPACQTTQPKMWALESNDFVSDMKSGWHKDTVPKSHSVLCDHVYQVSVIAFKTNNNNKKP